MTHPDWLCSLPTSLPHIPPSGSWVNDLDVHPGLSIHFCENYTKTETRRPCVGKLLGQSWTSLGLPVFSVPVCAHTHACYQCPYICVCLSPLAGDCPAFSVTCPDSRESVSEGPVPTAQCTHRDLLAGGVRHLRKQKRELIGMCGGEECFVTHRVLGAEALGRRNKNCLSFSPFSDRPRLMSRSHGHEQPHESAALSLRPQLVLIICGFPISKFTSSLKFTCKS